MRSCINPFTGNVDPELCRHGVTMPQWVDHNEHHSAIDALSTERIYIDWNTWINVGECTFCQSHKTSTLSHFQTHFMCWFIRSEMTVLWLLGSHWNGNWYSCTQNRCRVVRFVSRLTKRISNLNIISRLLNARKLCWFAWYVEQVWCYSLISMSYAMLR